MGIECKCKLNISSAVCFYQPSIEINREIEELHTDFIVVRLKLSPRPIFQTNGHQQAGFHYQSFWRLQYSSCYFCLKLVDYTARSLDHNSKRLQAVNHSQQMNLVKGIKLYQFVVTLIIHVSACINLLIQSSRSTLPFV